MKTEHCRGFVVLAVLALLTDKATAQIRFSGERAEERRAERFAALDDDGDGVLAGVELERGFGFRLLDRNRDERVTRAEAGIGVPMVRSLDLSYVAEGEPPSPLQTLDIYAPVGAVKAPVIVMIHGGGWSIGDKSNASVGVDKARVFVAEGYVYASLNYRLSPAVQHPEHVRDVAAGLAWLHEHVAAYGGDPAKIVVMGHSAGAHLAALVATDASRLEAHATSPQVLSGVILLDGAAYDLPATFEEGIEERALMKMYREAFSTDPERHRDASPRWHVKSDPPPPPFLIVHAGKREVSARRSRELADAIVAAGGRARVFHAENDSHAAVNREIGIEGDDVTAAIAEFLAEIGFAPITSPPPPEMSTPVAPLKESTPPAPSEELHDW